MKAESPAFRVRQDDRASLICVITLSDLGDLLIMWRNRLMPFVAEGQMMKSKLIGLVTSLMLFGAMPSQAVSLVDQGNTTYDPNTGLIWLDVSLTQGHSHDYVVANLLGVGQTYEGYRYATGAEVSTLFTDAGITNPYYGAPNAEAPSYQALIALLGSSAGNPPYTYPVWVTWGLTADINQAGNPWVAIVYLETQNAQWQVAQAHYTGLSLSPSEFSGTLGSFLVATPLPSTWLMLLSGFVGIGFLAYRGTKKRSAAIAIA